MRKFLYFSRIGLAVAISLANVSPAHAVVAEAISGAATSMTISQIFSGLDEVINRAQDSGDYLIMRAAIQLKGAIEAWKEANKELLDKAFSEIDQKQQNIFNNARQLTEQLSQGLAPPLEAAQQLTNQANQVIESIPVLTKNTYVTRYSPRVKPAQTSPSLTLRVNGVNLDKGDPVLQGASRMLVGPMEVQYTIPSGAIQGDRDKLSTVPLKLIYTTPKDGFWDRLTGAREQVERQIPIVVLPSNMANFVYTIETTTEHKVTKPFTSQNQEFKGSNETKVKIANPPEGWRWDWAQGLSAFKQNQGRGEAGSCHEIEANGSTPDGITHSAKLKKIQELKFSGIKYEDGYVNCSITGPIYQITPLISQIPPHSGVLTWTDDIRLAMPPGTSTVSLEINTFDGRKRLFSDTGSDKYFDVIRGNKELIIRPRQPTDL